MLSVFEFDDFRAYVKAWVSEEEGWSQSRLASALGVSRSSLSQSLNSEAANPRRFPDTSVAPLTRLLALEGEDRRYFLELVEAAQGRSEEKRAAARRRADAIRSFQEARAIQRPSYELYATWYHFAVWELAQLPGFRSDPEWIAGILMPPITRLQARESLELLDRLGLITTKEDGEVEVTSALLVDPEFSDEERNEALIHSYKDSLARAADSLDAFRGRSENVMYGAVTALDPEDYPKAREILRAAMQQLLALGQKTSGSGRVYQALVTFWPLSDVVREDSGVGEDSRSE